MLIECPYCKKKLGSKASLKVHLKSAKYCLKIRNVLIVEEENNKFICEYCEHGFSTKTRLDSHLQKCTSQVESLKSKYTQSLIQQTKLGEEKDRLCLVCQQQELDIQELRNCHEISEKEKGFWKCKIEEEYEKRFESLQHEYERKLQEKENKYEQRIDKLTERLENVAIQVGQKSTTTVNHTTNTNINTYIAQMENVTQEHFEKSAQFLTLDYIKKGVDGYVEYALRYPLQNRLVCVDLARKKIKYKDQHGNIITDSNMKKLTKQLFKSIQEINTTLTRDQLNELRKAMDDPLREPGSGIDEYIGKRTRIQEKRQFVNTSASGKEGPYYKQFVRTICEKTYV